MENNTYPLLCLVHLSPTCTYRVNYIYVFKEGTFPVVFLSGVHTTQTKHRTHVVRYTFYGGNCIPVTWHLFVTFLLCFDYTRTFRYTNAGKHTWYITCYSMIILYSTFPIGMYTNTYVSKQACNKVL